MNAGAVAVAEEHALFVYYKVPADNLAAVTAAMHFTQGRLRAEYPGLMAELWRRPQGDDAADQTSSLVTVMETYQRPGGIDASLAQTIEQAAATALAGHLRSPRHTELFQTL